MNRLHFTRHRLNWAGCKLGLSMSMLSMLVAPEFGFAQNFVQRTEECGIGSVAKIHGVAVADYDRDGDLDIYFVVQTPYKSTDPKTWNRLFSNNGNGTFQDVTAIAGVTGEVSDLARGLGLKTGASWGDYDNDGWPDLFITRNGPDQLLHNNGDGTFSDVTNQTGVAGRATQYSTSALWFDYDSDGDLDLYVSVLDDNNRTSRDTKNRMYENLGDGQFTDVSEGSGLADPGLTWMSVAIDANNDGHLDLYLANDFGRNKFYLNNGDKTFQERTTDFGLEDAGHGMGLAVGDCDRNGYFDIYLTNITELGNPLELNPLFLNTGENYFVNKAEEAGVSKAGWGWGTDFFDLENDGDEDLFVVTGFEAYEFTKRLFRNDSEPGVIRFTEIANDLGLAELSSARGLAIFDYDDDGGPDILISNTFKAPSLYQNRMERGNWLKVELEGTVSNRNAFGTVMEVSVNGQSYKKYHHGAQFLGQNIQPLHFGLGSAQAIEKITVKWPSGVVDEIGAVNVNQTIQVREGTGLASDVRQTPANQATAPNSIRLIGNYPNPFNGSTKIRFELGVPGNVELRIINLQGQIVRVIYEFFSDTGEKKMSWDGTDSKSKPVSSGLYFYGFRINNESAGREVGKMIYIK